MKEAGGDLEFQKAALLRDQIFELRKQLTDEDMPEWERVWKERARDCFRGAVL